MSISPSTENYIESLDIDEISKNSEFMKNIKLWKNKRKVSEKFKKFVRNITQHCDYLIDESTYDCYFERLCKIRGSTYYEMGYVWCWYEIPLWLESYINHYEIRLDLLFSTNTAQQNCVVYYFPPYDGLGYRMKATLCDTIKKRAVLFHLKRLFSHPIIFSPPKMLCSETDSFCIVPSEINYISEQNVWFEYNETDLPTQIKKWILYGGPEYVSAMR